MSEAKQTSERTKVERQGGFTTARRRRLVFGANVLVMSIAALAVVVFVNLISFQKHWRKDLGVAGTFQPSDRTKRILDQVDRKVRLTSVYTSTQEETSKDKYLPAVQDYFQELKLYAPDKVQADYVSNDSQKAELLGRIQGKYGQQAQAHREFVNAFFDLVKATQEVMPPPAATEPATTQPAETQVPLAQSLAQLTAALQQPSSYLAVFPQVVDLQARLNKDLQTLSEAQDEVKRLTLRSGLPRYGEAKQKITEVANSLKETLTTGQKTLQEIGGLAAVASPGGDEFFRTAQQRMDELATMVQDLQATVGSVEDKEIPADIKGAMQAFGKQAQKLAEAIEEEVRRQEGLARKYPAIAESAAWTIRQQIAGIFEQVIPLPHLLRTVTEQLAQVRPQIRALLSSADVPADQMATAIRNLRTMAAQDMQHVNVVARRVLQLREDLSQADAASAVFLEQARAGRWQSDLIGRIDALKERMDKLPEIKLSEVSDKLDSPNAIVAETDEKVDVLSFDDVWPQAEPLRSLAGTEEPRRVFNGDVAIGGAVFALARPPVATVIFAHYFREAPPQMRQFMPPQIGSIPYQQLETLRGTLTKANMVVKEWNLAEQTDPPQPDADTQAVYVFLPPPDDAPMPGPRQEGFGDVQLTRVKDLFKGGAKAIFLARWEPPRRGPMPFMPGPEASYRYADLLRDDFGVDVRFKYRTICGTVESRETNRYGVNVQRWAYMPLNTFTDHPIGKPLQARRALTVDVCPVEPAVKAPAGRKVERLLVVPARDEYWATDDVLKLIRSVVNDEKGGLVAKLPTDQRAPFPVALAVADDKNQPQAVVLGTGASVLDGYLNERVARIGGKNERITFDPPPTANADLVINAVLWLAGRSDLIGAGPVVLPPVQPISEGQLELIRATVWVMLPGLVLASGMVMWFVRRR